MSQYLEQLASLCYPKRFYRHPKQVTVIFNMGVYGGLGPMTNAVLWVEAVIFAVFVGLRLYTRKYILNSVGFDDYLVLIALVRTTSHNTSSTY
jgi:hypothetical protein